MDISEDKKDERVLVERAQQGDRKALGQVLIMHGPRIYKFVLLPKLGVTSAKEVLSEVYVRTATTITRFVWQASGLYPYMKTIAVRLVIDEFRRKKRSPLWSGEDVEHTLPDTQEISEKEEREDIDAKRTQLRNAMATLHPRYRDVLTLRVLEDRSREEVSAIMSVNVATLDVLLSRATKALKAALVPASKETP